MLKFLKQFGASGTFFCVGENAARYPEIISQIRDQGHSLGNHTFNHIKGWQSNDMDYISNTLKAIPVTSARLFRPPYGRITRKQGAILRSQGFRIVMWSLLSCDYLKNLDRQKSLDSLVKHSHPGSIIVFHDSAKAMENMYWILPRYLEIMKQKGFQFAAL